MGVRYLHVTPYALIKRLKQEAAYLIIFPPMASVSSLAVLVVPQSQRASNPSAHAVEKNSNNIIANPGHPINRPPDSSLWDTKGLIQLAQRTGQYKTINSGVVYEGELVGHNKLSGELDLSGERISDDVVGYFGYIKLISGFEKTLYMTKQEVGRMER